MDLAAASSASSTGLASALLYAFLNNKIVGFASGAIAITRIWKGRDRFRSEALMAWITLVYLTVRGALFLGMYECWDFHVYCTTGAAVVAGTDPYASALSQYPVNALPLFGLFALLPFRAASILWYGFNITALVVSIRLAAILAKEPGKHDGNASSWYGNATALLAVLLAGATTWSLDAGQLVAWTTLWIYLGIDALRRGKQVKAGVALAAASLKITTSLPFLLLPFDRKHARTLCVFGVAVAILCLGLYPLSRLPAMERSHLENVKQARQVGEINDYTFTGPYHDDLLGLEHWLYCLGFRDSGLISAVQLLALALAGLGLLWDFRLRPRQRDDRLLAVLLCLYSCLFLYHRIYDAVIVALPLVYCLEQARSSLRAVANTYRAIATGLILVLNFPRGGLMLRFAEWTQHNGLLGRLAQVAILPCCTWILLAAFGMLWFLGRQPRPWTAGGEN
jgi:hypothetical protein